MQSEECFEQRCVSCCEGTLLYHVVHVLLSAQLLARPTGISRTTLRGWQHNAKTACSKNVHKFVPRQALVEEAGSRPNRSFTAVRSFCLHQRVNTAACSAS